MVGHLAAIHLRERGHRVTGAARRELPFCRTVIADARKREDVKTALAGGRYDAVINCVGILNREVDACPHDGIYLNACLPHLLAELVDGTAARVFHISTDCVFSGAGAGGYREGDFRDADGLYGRSKALGELGGGNCLTFRASIVGPDPDPEGVGLFNWFMRQSGIVKGYSRAIWGGVTAPVLARALEAALEQGLAGLCHLTNGSGISKFGLLSLFNRLRREPVRLEESPEAAGDKSLICSRNDFSFVVPSYPEMAEEMGRWIKSHAWLYRHYDMA